MLTLPELEATLLIASELPHLALADVLAPVLPKEVTVCIIFQNNGV